MNSLQSDLRLSIRRAVGPMRRHMMMRLKPHHFKETYINAALPSNHDSVYLEIGVRDGDSFRKVNAARKIGVDPLRSVRMRHLRHGEEYFEMTSDEFFETSARRVLAGGVDVALVDGLHHFRQALKDVLNLEHYMAPSGLIVLDDSNPPNRQQASPVQCAGNWNGDVWKVMALLRTERPDLSCVTIDADQGIGLIWGFDGSAKQVDEDSIRRVEGMDFDALAEDREGVIGLQPSQAKYAHTRVRVNLRNASE